MTNTTDYTPEWPPNWTDAKDDGLRSYASPDSVLIQTESMTRCTVRNSAAKFVSRFGPVFTVFFLAVCWFGIDGFRERIAFMTLGLFCGTATFALIYTLMRHHETCGDYVIVDRKAKIVELPRHQRKFHFEKILCFQLLIGGEKDQLVMNDSDLNVIVADGGNAIRFRLIGNPDPDHAEAIARAVGVRLFRDHCPPGWYRSSDRQNKAMQRSTAFSFLAGGKSTVRAR